MFSTFPESNVQAPGRKLQHNINLVKKDIFKLIGESDRVSSLQIIRLSIYSICKSQVMRVSEGLVGQSKKIGGNSMIWLCIYLKTSLLYGEARAEHKKWLFQCGKDHVIAKLWVVQKLYTPTWITDVPPSAAHV